MQCNMQKSKSLPNLHALSIRNTPHKQRKVLSANCLPTLNIEQAFNIVNSEIQMESITHTSTFQAGMCAIQSNELPFEMLNRTEVIENDGLHENEKDLLACLLECSTTDLFSEIVLDFDDFDERTMMEVAKEDPSVLRRLLRLIRVRKQQQQQAPV